MSWTGTDGLVLDQIRFSLDVIADRIETLTTVVADATRRERLIADVETRDECGRCRSIEDGY